LRQTRLTFLLLLNLCLSGGEANAQTVNQIIVKVTGINVSYMPGAVQINVDNLPNVCSKLETLTYRNANPEAVKAVYSAALAAMLSNYYAVIGVYTVGASSGAPYICDLKGLAICNPINQQGCAETPPLGASSAVRKPGGPRGGNR
jgi:hypothetical protein